MPKGLSQIKGLAGGDLDLSSRAVESGIDEDRGGRLRHEFREFGSVAWADIGSSG